MKKKLLFMTAFFLGGCGNHEPTAPVKPLADLKETNVTFEKKVRVGEERREALSKDDKTGVPITMLSLVRYAVGEFSEGLPPRFVVRGIPARINRLRLGMTWEETRDILGLEKSWLEGGTNAAFWHGEGNGHHEHEVYYVRPPRVVMEMAREGGGPVKPIGFLQSKATIQLWFDTNIDSGVDYRADNATRLKSVSFSSDGTVVAEMPHQR